MKVTQEKLPASQIGLEIEITPEMSKKAYEQVVKDLARNANIPGFRKGKIPRHILLQRFGSSRLKAAAVEEVIRESIPQAIQQEAIAALGNYELRSNFDELVNQFTPGESLIISAAVDVAPEVKLNQYTGLSIQAEEVKYDSKQVDDFLEERRKEQATLVPVEGRSAQMGDVAVVDFNGRLVSEGEGETETSQEIPGGQAEDFQIELAEGRFIEGFIDGIVGMNPGDTKDVSAKFPENYPQQDLAGKPAVFTITLKELKEKELPEVNDDFAQEVSEFQTLAELRSTLESRFQETAEKKTTNNKQQVLLDELLKQLEVDLPETLIEQEVNSLLTQTAVRLSNQGIDVKKLFSQEMLPRFREQSRPEAIDRIKRSLVIQEVAKLESIQVEPAEVEARVKELSEQYRDENIDPVKLQDFVQEDLLNEKVLGWLEAHSTFELLPEGSLKNSDEEQPEAAETSAAAETPQAESEPSASEG